MGLPENKLKNQLSVMQKRILFVEVNGTTLKLQEMIS